MSANIVSLYVLYL